MSKSSTATVDHHTNLLNINYIIIDKIISNQTNPKLKSSKWDPVDAVGVGSRGSW